MNKHLLSGIAATTFVASLAFAAPASAAVTFDSASGTGFVGKGDVQTAFAWNDATLNQNASALVFETVSETVTEVSWECTLSSNQKIQERERTTTETTSGVVSATARDNKTKKITGFNLAGYSVSNTSEISDGPKVNSCPNNATLSTAAGDPVVLSDTSELTVTHNAITHVL